MLSLCRFLLCQLLLGLQCNYPLVSGQQGFIPRATMAEKSAVFSNAIATQRAKFVALITSAFDGVTTMLAHGYFFVFHHAYAIQGAVLCASGSAKT